MKPDFIGHQFRRVQLFTHPVGHSNRRDPPRLGASDPASGSPSGLQTHFGQLGGLARSGFSQDDNNLMVFDHLDDLLPQLADREGFRIRKLHEIMEIILS